MCLRGGTLQLLLREPGAAKYVLAFDPAGNVLAGPAGRAASSWAVAVLSRGGDVDLLREVPPDAEGAHRQGCRNSAIHSIVSGLLSTPFADTARLERSQRFELALELSRAWRRPRSAIDQAARRVHCRGGRGRDLPRHARR